MSRGHRVPGTSSGTLRREIAFGGDPVRALTRALAELRVIRRGEIWSVGIAHDRGCPAVEGGGMGSCSCELVELAATRVA